MENRWSLRTPIRMNVVIHASGNGLISGRSRDVSLGGMYVETAPNVYIGMQTALRVGFMVKDEMKVARALVTRTEQGGFGFMFDEVDPEMQRSVYRLLKTVSTAPATAPTG